jgi:hypothetical protein
MRGLVRQGDQQKGEEGEVVARGDARNLPVGAADLLAEAAVDGAVARELADQEVGFLGADVTEHEASRISLRTAAGGSNPCRDHRRCDIIL